MSFSMLSLSASRPTLLARTRSPAAARSTLAARTVASVAAAPRSTITARRPLSTTAAAAMTKPEVECSSSSSSAPSSPPAEAFVFKASLAALVAAPPNLLLTLASHADEAAVADVGGGFKISPFEILLVLAPVVFYALLSAYRKLVNPKASISDGLFIVVALVIVANVVSILAFHKRIY